MVDGQAGEQAVADFRRRRWQRDVFDKVEIGRGGIATGQQLRDGRVGARNQYHAMTSVGHARGRQQRGRVVCEPTKQHIGAAHVVKAQAVSEVFVGKKQMVGNGVHGGREADAAAAARLPAGHLEPFGTSKAQ